MRHISVLLAVLFVFSLNACSSTSSSSSGTTTEVAADYATFGQTLSAQIPAGLKVGGVNAQILAIAKDLQGECATDYTDCPDITAENGGDSFAGEILSRLWGIDYDEECTQALIDAGTCFNCVDCNETGTDFIEPTFLADPTTCATTSSTDARYVNFGIDPCRFDAIIAQISNLSTCIDVAGVDTSIASVVPWYASWGMPESITFSGFQSGSSDGGLWWSVKSGTSGTDQYFISVDSDWLYGSVRNTTSNRFVFFGTGSPAYYAGLGEGSGINIAGYAGTYNPDDLTVSTENFEAIQIRDQSPNSYANRMISNGSYVWAQSWNGTDFPSTPAELAGVKDSPSETRCLEIGTSVVTSKYVSLDACIASFGKASATELNMDDNFILKLVDGETAGSVDFTSRLTSVEETSCVTAEDAN